MSTSPTVGNPDPSAPRRSCLVTEDVCAYPTGDIDAYRAVLTPKPYTSNP